MIPSAKIATRWSPPPENRLRNPRMFEPEKLSWMSSTAWVSIPGTGMCDPSR
jgi:hypothetical protein